MSFSGRWTRMAVAMGAVYLAGTASAQDEPAGGTEMEVVAFDTRLDTVMTHDDGEFLWFHPRVVAVPGRGKDGGPAVVMTLQKHLHKSDFYSGLSVMRSDDLGATWSDPVAPPELGWRHDGDEVIALCDVTPGWHAPTGKVIAIGAKVRYLDGVQLYDKPQSRAGGYAVWDPKTGAWTPWTPIDLPEKEGLFYSVTPGCTQWLVEDNGTILLAVYCEGPGDGNGPYSSTVVRLAFDGEALSYVDHGDVLELDVVRGLVEPQLAKYKGRYYLSLRNDVKGYVTAGDDGLHYAPIKPWTFDDGEEPGTYNTQQHWVTHSGGLFLSYTRRGADNDHIARHRAPLFVAQVNPDTLQIVRATEQAIIPERGASLGNFGVANITPGESWVTVSEGVWNDAARKRGATGATFVGRVVWSEPNELVR
ncbi:MAG: exo-alpha-sialidase [bacterium]|nr:exo-alpha-sialidase [bacterium]